MGVACPRWARDPGSVCAAGARPRGPSDPDLRVSRKVLAVLTKIRIKNYRVFEDFELELNDGLNILVGDNDSGKSTLLEAVRLAITGRLGDRLLAYCLSPYLVNQAASSSYAAAVRAGETPTPPEIIIDLYLAESEATAGLRGTNNSTLEDAPGLRVRAWFNKSYNDEYEAFIADREAVALVPTEYYQVDWLSFAGNAITSRGVPLAVSRIDASAIRLFSGADYYLQQLITDQLEASERVELSRSYRSLREEFADNEAIKRINATLAADQHEITDKSLSLAIDISERTTWESSLVPHLDDLPFQFVGHGSQNILKILLALNRSVEASQVVLIEEPENHLSPASLNGLVGKIAERCADKQVLIATHSSYVLNKLGLDRLVLLADQSSTRLTDLPPETLDYFKKLSGYDTLRLVLASRVILVEGPSDELIIQRAYVDKEGRLPIEDGIDVLNVRGLSFKRFLDIARLLGKRISVVTDNDGRAPAEIDANFAEYTDTGIVTVHTGGQADGSTLEPQVLAANGLSLLNEILGREDAEGEAIVGYMTAHKTTWALAVYEAPEAITMPQYIRDALEP